jgi:hypothetical protein
MAFSALLFATYKDGCTHCFITKCLNVIIVILAIVSYEIDC